MKLLQMFLTDHLLTSDRSSVHHRLDESRCIRSSPRCMTLDLGGWLSIDAEKLYLRYFG